MRLTLLAALCALALPLVTAGVAHADTYSCAFTGVADFTAQNSLLEARADDGIESILSDVQNNEGDGGGGGFLMDTDNGNGPLADGTYGFSTAWGAPSGTAECLYVNDDGNGAGYTGVYDAVISSSGSYNNRVCGTGQVWDSGSTHTEVDIEPPGLVDPEDIAEANYWVDVTAGQGTLDVTSARNLDGESGPGPTSPVEGHVSIVPTDSFPPDSTSCVDGDVTAAQLSGAFALHLAAPQP